MKMNRKVIIRWLLPLMLAVAVSGCIKNDIPYPRLLGRITAFEVRGQIGEAVIDSIARTVTVDIEDTAVLTRLRLLRFELSDHTSVSPEIDSVIDLSSPKTFSLTTWPDQSYEWTVSATQTVERYIRVQNQVGEAVFNVDEHYAIFYVTFEQPLETVNITDMKLGPSNSTIEPDPSTVHDFSGPQRFTVRYRDVEELWTVVAYQKEAVLETGQADAWATAAYLYGTIPAGDGNAGFRYRTAGADFGFYCAGADGNRGASGDVCTPSLSAVFSGSGMEEKHPAGILANSVKLWYDTLRFAGLEGRPVQSKRRGRGICK